MIKLNGNPVFDSMWNGVVRHGDIFTSFKDRYYFAFEVRSILSEEICSSFETLMAYVANGQAFDFGVEKMDEDFKSQYCLKISPRSFPSIENLLGIIPSVVSNLFSIFDVANFEIHKFNIEFSRVADRVDKNGFMDMVEEDFDVLSDQEFLELLDSVGGFLNSEFYTVKIQASVSTEIQKIKGFLPFLKFQAGEATIG